MTGGPQRTVDETKSAPTTDFKPSSYIKHAFGFVGDLMKEQAVTAISAALDSSPLGITSSIAAKMNYLSFIFFFLITSGSIEGLFVFAKANLNADDDDGLHGDFLRLT